VARVLCDRTLSTELIDQLLDERAAAAHHGPALAEGCCLLDAQAQIR